MNAVLEAARNNPFLNAGGFADPETLERLTDRRRYAPGETILTEGETDRSLWIVLNGRCEVVKGTNGHARSLATIEPGGVFGEMSFLQPAPHSASVRATSDVEVARLSPAAFETLQTESPAAARYILGQLVQQLADRLRRMDERVCAAEERSPQERWQEWHDFRARVFAGSDIH